MFTADESLEQIRTAGRTAASIRVNIELLASASVAVISANTGRVSFKSPSSPIRLNCIGATNLDNAWDHPSVTPDRGPRKIAS